MGSPKDLSVHFSSASNEWQTPPWLFNLLHTEFGFDLDAAATDVNHLCPRYYTAAQDALKQDWGKDGSTVWLNPPYGRLIGQFIPYAYTQTRYASHLTVVCLIPARVDTRWWHDACAHGEVRFLRGRIGFINPSLPSYSVDKPFKISPAPFPSAVVAFGPKAQMGKTRYVSYKAPKTSS